VAFSQAWREPGYTEHEAHGNSGSAECLRNGDSEESLAAEFIDTFWLVLGGCASVTLAANFPGAGAENSLGTGFVGVSLAFGLTVMTCPAAGGRIESNQRSENTAARRFSADLSGT